MCIYMYIYIYIYVYMHAQYIWEHMCVCMSVGESLCIHIYARTVYLGACMCIDVCVEESVCVLAHMYIHTLIFRIYICIYIYLCTHSIFGTTFRSAA